MPPYATLTATAVVSVLKLSGIDSGTGKPGLSDGVDLVRKIQSKSKDVAATLAKFNYIMNSDNRYLMLHFEGRNKFLDELNNLKEKIQQREYIKYDNAAENDVYKEALLEHVNKIYNMNKNFDSYNERLKYKLQEIEKAVTQVDAETIKKQIYTPILPIQ